MCFPQERIEGKVEELGEDPWVIAGTHEVSSGFCVSMPQLCVVSRLCNCHLRSKPLGVCLISWLESGAFPLARAS